MTSEGLKLEVDVLEIPGILVPGGIKRRGTDLVWKHSWRESGPQLKAVDDDLLPEFLSLSNASDRRIREFTKRYGVLALCEHGLPFCHNLPRLHFPGIIWNPHLRRFELEFPAEAYGDSESSISFEVSRLNQAALSPRDVGCFPQLTKDRWFFESFDAWRMLAQAVGGLCRLSYSLARGKAGSEEDWLCIIRQFETTNVIRSFWQMELKTQRQMLSTYLNRMVRWGATYPTLSWSEDVPRLAFAPPLHRVGGLWGTIAIKILFQANRVGGIEICYHCGLPYVLDRRPRAGQRTFCQVCRGKKKPGAYASAEYRKSKSARARRSERQ